MIRVVSVDVVALGLLSPAACATPGSEVVDGPGIVGTYTVNGIDPAGNEYSGTVVIAATDSSNEYVIEWLVTGAIQQGIGRLDGDRFEATWETVSSASGSSTGSASYVIDAEGNLIGTRTVDGANGVGTEEIFVEA